MKLERDASVVAGYNYNGYGVLVGIFLYFFFFWYNFSTGKV